MNSTIPKLGELLTGEAKLERAHDQVVALGAEVDRLRAQLNAERSRAAGLEQ